MFWWNIWIVWLEAKIRYTHFLFPLRFMQQSHFHLCHTTHTHTQFFFLDDAQFCFTITFLVRTFVYSVTNHNKNTLCTSLNHFIWLCSLSQKYKMISFQDNPFANILDSVINFRCGKSVFTEEFHLCTHAHCTAIICICIWFFVTHFGAFLNRVWLPHFAFAICNLNRMRFFRSCLHISEWWFWAQVKCENME